MIIDQPNVSGPFHQPPALRKLAGNYAAIEALAPRLLV
jgi:hypothetical protein